MTGVTDGQSPSKSRSSAVSVPPHSAGLYFLNMCATRMFGERGLLADRDDPLGNRFFVEGFLVGPFAVPQEIQAGGGSNQDMKREEDRGLAEHPFGQALQEDAANSEEDSNTHSSKRVGRAPPQKASCEPKPAQPERSKDPEADPAHFTDGDNSQVVGGRSVLRTPIINDRAVEHRLWQVVVIFVRMTGERAV